MGRRRRCVGINKNGERCRVRALQNEYYCRRHLENMDDYPTCSNFPDYLYDRKTRKEKYEYRYPVSTSKQLDISNDYKNHLPARIFRENDRTYNFSAKPESSFFEQFIKPLFILLYVVMLFFLWISWLFGY